MANPWHSVGAFAAAVAGAACLFAAPIAAQAPAKSGAARSTTGKYTAPRTANNQPDLQGVWANNSVTPLERPDFFKGRTTMTDQELETLKRNAAELFAQRQAGDLLGDRLIQEILKDPNLRPFDPNTGNYNSFWVVDRDWDNRTSLIVDPPDGKMPALTDQARSRRGRGGQASEFPEGPEQVSNSVRCISYGVPNLLAGYNSYFQITQGKGYVAIMQEMIHDVRIVPLDGGPHVDKSIRLWNGDSRGHWEGDTLVVDTTNYSRAGAIRGASENLHLIERFTRVSPDTVEYSLTFDDPTVWTKPWTAMLRLKSTPDKIYEYACHEGNHSIVGILGGARAKEKKSASSTASK
jgi:hypothetical protein